MSAWAEILLAIHLLSAVTWVGGSVYFELLVARARSAADAERVGYVVRDAAWIGDRVFSVASLLLLITGILLVDELGYGFGDAWISFALTALLVSIVVSGAYLAPQARRLGALLEREGLSSAALAQLGRVAVVARIVLLLLLLVVVDMAVKPGAA